MLPEEAAEIEDKDEVYHLYFDGMQRKFLKTLVSDEIIEEHKNKPLGQHSEALERILLYFRRVSKAKQLAVKRDALSETFKIVAFSGVRGTPPRLLDDKKYATIEEAYHGIFLKQLNQLMES